MKPNEKTNRKSVTGSQGESGPSEVKNPPADMDTKKLPCSNIAISKEAEEIIVKFREMGKGIPPRVKMTIREGKEIIVTEGDDSPLSWAKMMEATGTVDECLISGLLNQVSGTFLRNDQSATVENMNSALAILYGAKPKDELEGMLVVQMIGTHNAALEMLRRAMWERQTPEGVNENVNIATKLLRSYTAQLETLSRYRNKGQQKVTVEHVNVGAGGQAIVGVVENQVGGGTTHEKK